MNEITIKVLGKDVKLRFGSWLMMNMIESGYGLEQMGEEIKRNPFKFIPKLIYLAACNGKTRSLSDYEENDFFDYLDGVGFNSDEVVKVTTLFAESLMAHLGSKGDTVEVKEKVAKKK